MSRLVEIKIDRSTLPNDGQRVKWQTYEDANKRIWKEGVFSAGEDCFCEGFDDVVRKWDLIWNVFHWRAFTDDEN